MELQTRDITHGIELLRRQGLLQQEQEEEKEEKEKDERERGEVRTTSRRTRMYGSRIRRCTTTRRCQRTSIDSDDDYNSRMDDYHHPYYYYYAHITRSMQSPSRSLRRIIAGIAAATIGVAVAAMKKPSLCCWSDSSTSPASSCK